MKRPISGLERIPRVSRVGVFFHFFFFLLLQINYVLVKGDEMADVWGE